MKMTAFWDVAPCSLVEVDRFFRGEDCLHHKYAPLKRRPASTRLRGTTSQKAVIFILLAMRT
jgi:hypothetical protein